MEQNQKNRQEADAAVSGMSRRDMLSALPVTAGAAAGLGGLFAFGSSAAAQPQGRGLTPKLEKTLASIYDGNKYTLPDLPYDYDALEPHIDQLTMELHHDKHHQGYVDGLNKTVAALARNPDDEALVGGLQRDLSFNYGGHVLHSIFWAVMGPGEDGEMGGNPRGNIANAIESDFGGFDAFKTMWSNAAGTVKGSGWVTLLFDPVSTKLCIKTFGDHDRYAMAGTMPILPLDVWEHAFYLNYQNRKSEYVTAFLNVIDWRTVSSLYDMVSAPYRRG